MACIKKIQVDDTIYEAKIDFKTAIECNRIATDDTIGDFERVLGIICTMFGGKAIDNPNHYEKLLKWALNYLSCGEEVKNDEEPDMDFIQDYDYIWTSMYSDYNGLDIDKEEIDWHKFIKLMNGLSNSETGNCCILNRVRNLRNFNINDIKDPKERDKIIKAKAQVELKKPQKKVNLTESQQKSVDEFYKSLGF